MEIIRLNWISYSGKKSKAKNRIKKSILINAIKNETISLLLISSRSTTIAAIIKMGRKSDKIHTGIQIMANFNPNKVISEACANMAITSNIKESILNTK